MHRSELAFGSTTLIQDNLDVVLKTVEMNGETYFKIENYTHMNPFFMTIVSDSDHWMFISSTGGLTCGRKNPDSALFPYYTDDKIHDSFETTGSNTVIIVCKDDKNFLWKPFSLHHSNVYSITRNLYKNTLGNKIMFEEINHDLGVCFNYTWKNSEKYGFVKHSQLTNISKDKVTLKVLDGIRNILPYGVNTQHQSTQSTLVDGYKRCELVEDVGVGLYTMSSLLSDRAEPSESLKATTVWSTGLQQPTYLLSEIQVDAFTHNVEIKTEHDIKGRRGSYYVAAQVDLEEGATKSWVIVSELNQSAVNVIALIDTIKSNTALFQDIELNVVEGSRNLHQLVFNADGLQCTQNEKASYRHFTNTLFNIMRGGVYAEGYTLDTHDFIAFVSTWNVAVAAKHARFLDELPTSIHFNELYDLVIQQNCHNLERLVMEYLPLTFSRRHGDPSRPWNRFSIEVVKDDGSKKLNFEGNWRDIFQNWEALSLSYPAFIENIIAKFVNASTADGYNPYRITKSGFDWESLHPEEPWSNIGYWGDHQIIYLLKLMELSQAYHPTKLQKLLLKEIFVYANVPYKIKGFEALVEDPRNTIDFDKKLETQLFKRAKEIGADGKLLTVNEEIYHVNLIEKLLVTLLSKLSNFVPEGGIWMNTQRPEWNDANNALVGNGLSMVTLYYLHRFQTFMQKLVDKMDVEHVAISQEVLAMFETMHEVLRDSTHYLNQPISHATRFAIVKKLGVIGENYRTQVYEEGFSAKKGKLAIADLKAFIDVTIMHLQDSIHKNKRTDGLYHAYNLIRFEGESCSISHLYEMLEGQVSVLSSKALNAQESLDVIKALRQSAIYREDQDSYMLYPNRELPKFLEKNVIPTHMVMGNKVLATEVAHNRSRFIEKDIRGNYHFNGKFRNGHDLAVAIRATQAYSESDIKAVQTLFSDLFNHHAFTGRSGTFYKYEGLGSIYWHMVSKLVLAAQENCEDLYSQVGVGEATKTLSQYYRQLKAGIGVDKSPRDYGAFPTDAYSHTPSFSGVQQPGLTGQVKEDFIIRMRELGVNVSQGCIQFIPQLLERREFLTQTRQWIVPNVVALSEAIELTLAKDSLGFTLCGVPVVYCLADKTGVKVTLNTGDVVEYEGQSLDAKLSSSIFNRDGVVRCVYVAIDGSTLQ